MGSFAYNFKAAVDHLGCVHASVAICFVVIILRSTGGFKSLILPRKFTQVYLPGPRFNIKISSYQYRKSHCGDNTVVRSSYLHNGISYTGKMSSLYWVRALALRCFVTGAIAPVAIPMNLHIIVWYITTTNRMSIFTDMYSIWEIPEWSNSTTLSITHYSLGLKSSIISRLA